MTTMMMMIYMMTSSASLDWSTSMLRRILLCTVLMNLLCKVVSESDGGGAGQGDADTGDYFVPILERICADDLKRVCPNLLGKSVNISNCEVTDCISRQLWKEREPQFNGESEVSKECSEAMTLFQRQRGYDLDLDKRLWDVCGEQANMMVLPQFAIYDLLRTPVGVDSLQLSEACQQEIFLRKRDCAYDYRVDNKMATNCDEDIKKLCSRVPPTKGRVQECLRKHVENRTISYKCNAELYRQERENMDDWRLNLPLWRACYEDRLKFCPDVEDGKSRVLDCLEDNRQELSQPCFQEFDKVMLRRSVDYRFDYHIVVGCAEDLDKICKPAGVDLKDELPPDARVLQCLQDNIEMLKQESCYKAVSRVIKRAAEDLRFDLRTSDWCREDLEEYCDMNKTGHGQLLQCLEKNMEYLDDDCEDAIFRQEVRFSQSIDFKYNLKNACLKELEVFCAGQNPEKQIQCLYQKYMERPLDKAMGRACQKAVYHDMDTLGDEYCFNYPLRKECSGDISRLCSMASKSLRRSFLMRRCHESVLQCLWRKTDQIKSKECHNELMFHEEMLKFLDELEEAKVNKT